MPVTLSGGDLTTRRSGECQAVFQVGTQVEVEFRTRGRRYGATVVKCDTQRAVLETLFRPRLGSVIRIGRVKAYVVAHLASSVVVEFHDIDG
jgi:hypothetical protein